MSKTRINTQKLLDFIADKFINDDLDNESLVEIIKLCGDYLNLMSVVKYAKDRKMTYQGVIKPVKSGRRIVELFGNRFVIDNE